MSDFEALHLILRVFWSVFGGFFVGFLELFVFFSSAFGAFCLFLRFFPPLFEALCPFGELFPSVLGFFHVFLGLSAYFFCTFPPILFFFHQF